MDWCHAGSVHRPSGTDRGQDTNACSADGQRGTENSAAIPCRTTPTLTRTPVGLDGESGGSFDSPLPFGG
jgi:hypothetical protein